MSFAYDVKAELCKVPINRSCCAVAEGCGVLLYASAFTANEVRIVTAAKAYVSYRPKKTEDSLKALSRIFAKSMTREYALAPAMMSLGRHSSAFCITAS